MQFQYTPYILPLIAAAVISSWVAIYSWSRRSALVSATALAFMAVVIAEWSLGYALEIAGANLETKLFWGKIQYIGIAAAPLTWFAFAINHSTRDKSLSTRSILLLAIIPTVTVLLAFTTERHGLIWNDFRIEQANDFSVLGVSHGLWFWVHSAYSYVLLLWGTVVVIRRSIWRKQGLYRRQAAAMLIAVLAPWFGNIIYLAGLSPIRSLDLTPFAFTFSVAALALGVFGFRLIDLVPIARGTVLEELKDGVIVVDARGNIADINPYAQNLLGVSASQVIGRQASDAFAPWSDLVKHYASVVDASDEVTIGEGESQRWFELHLSSLHDRRSRFIGRVITLHEITGRKRAEALVQENEARYRQIVENASDIIYRTDANGYFTYVNPTALHLMGFRAEADVLGKHFLDLTMPDWREKSKRFYLRQYFSRQANTYFEFPALTANGETIWLGQSVQIIEEGGRVVGFQAVARNINAIKQAQDALAIARDQALEASHLKSLLLAKVSHELRTPLSGILGYAELLRADAFGGLAERQKEVISHMIDSAQYLNELINELLDEAQLEAKSLVLRPDYCSPYAILKKVEANMAVLARSRGLDLLVAIDSRFPETIYSDEQRLRQILINLIGNAIKFTEAGEVRVNIFQPDSKHWCMKVSDTGVGISKKDQPAIFEPFRRVDNSMTHYNRGAGLGLSITKQMIELMGGRIVLESEIGKGSTFTVLLPLLAGPREGDGSRPYALVVEEDPSLAHIFTTILREVGYKTDIDAQGDQVMDKLSSRRPALIALNLHMPLVAKTNMLHQIRSDPRWAGTPMIIMTDDPQLAQSLEGQVEGVLTQPVSIARFTEIAIRLVSGEGSKKAETS